MREIAFDTETTGLSADQGDRIVEIGCVELINYVPTGRELHIYVNPGREMSEGAQRVTGLSWEMLRDKPDFSHPSVVDALLDFFGESQIVAHNSEFDRGFVNAELKRLGRATLPRSRFIDTVEMAREHRPGAPANLDAVCKRFNISLEGRDLHGALKDARLLAMAYLELRGGRERKFEFTDAAALRAANRQPAPQRPTPLASLVTEAEREAHAAFLATFNGAAAWEKFERG